MAGVTGTNGKSTVATLISAVMGHAGLPAGFIGTLGYRFGERTFPGGHTTPEASDLFRTLRRMRDAGARGVAMEVSSHALDMGRVAGASFDVAVFTNTVIPPLTVFAPPMGIAALNWSVPLTTTCFCDTLVYMLKLLV